MDYALEAVEPIGHMPSYSPEHIAVLAVTVIAAIVLVPVFRKLRGSASESHVYTVSGYVMLAVTIIWTVWGLLPTNWDINQSLPFHFSDALRFITAIALITRTGWAIAISYYWGLTLNIQSIITPDLNYFQFPVLEFAAYWLLHVVALLAPIVMTWGSGFRPTWRAYGIGYLATAIWAGIAITVNTFTGANYAYLSHAPAGASLLDVLGPWPTYILWEGVLIAVVWALMTWPWERKHARSIPYWDRTKAIRRLPVSYPETTSARDRSRMN